MIRRTSEGRGIIPAAQRADRYARRVDVAAAREINKIPAVRHSTDASILRAAGVSVRLAPSHSPCSLAQRRLASGGDLACGYSASYGAGTTAEQRAGAGSQAGCTADRGTAAGTEQTAGYRARAGRAATS
jgi:hypothetical protein